MSLSRGELIREIKKHNDKNGQPYTHIWTKSGRTKIEDAPEGNLFYCYLRVTGKMKKEVKKTLKSKEHQLEFNFV